MCHSYKKLQKDAYRKTKRYKNWTGLKQDNPMNLFSKAIDKNVRHEKEKTKKKGKEKKTTFKKVYICLEKVYVIE